MYTEKESFKHKVAKNLLTKWLKMVDVGLSSDIKPFVWRRSYGVYAELKFYESSRPHYFEDSLGLVDPGKSVDFMDIDRGKILFVPDITVFSQGVAHILIEVVHKNPVSAKKLSVIKDFYKDQWVELYEVSADSILNNIGIPNKVQSRLIFSN